MSEINEKERSDFVSLKKQFPHFNKVPYHQCGTIYYHEKKFSEKDIKYEKDGWVCAKKYRPLPFSLNVVRCKRDDEAEVKERNGWWTGQIWDGVGITKKTEILFWKKGEHYE